jgi:hypothetical protein
MNRREALSIPAGVQLGTQALPLDGTEGPFRPIDHERREEVLGLCHRLPVHLSRPGSIVVAIDPIVERAVQERVGWPTLAAWERLDPVFQIVTEDGYEAGRSGSLPIPAARGCRQEALPIERVTRSNAPRRDAGSPVCIDGDCGARIRVSTRRRCPRRRARAVEHDGPMSRG